MSDEEDGIPLEDRAAAVIGAVRDFAADLPITVEMRPYRNAYTGEVQGIVLTDLFAETPGNGIGSAVVREMLRLAEAADVNVYTDAEGPRSAEFYLKMGFEPSRGRGHQFAWHPPLPAEMFEDDDGPVPGP